MKKFLIGLLLVLTIGTSAIFVGKSFFGGGEDTWICSNGQWVKHGNPSKPMPQTGCGEAKENWQSQTVDEIGVSFKHPADTTFRKEVAQDSAGIHAVGFYVEKEGYTLYGVYQPNKEANEQDLEKSKIGMDATTIKEVTIAGIKGIEGLVTGPKTRYMTVLLRNSRILTISTFPPTQGNKALTDQILATLSFK